MHRFMDELCLNCNKFSYCNNNDLICVSKYKAKEQECETQRHKLNYYIKKTTQLLDDIDNYKQALEEIEELAKQNNFLVRDPFCGTGYRDLSGQILDIINKVKDSE